MENRLDKFFKEIIGKDRIIGIEKKLDYSVMILFCEKDGEINILFEKRAKDIAQGGEISFPGGRKEKSDKDYIETALRETFEEIGISKEIIDKVQHYGRIFLPTGQVIDIQLGYIHNFSFEKLNINLDEVEEILLVPLQFFIETEPNIEMIKVENRPNYMVGDKMKLFPVEELRIPKRYKKPWGHEREVYFYNYKNEVIWGITGEIIYSLIKDIKNIEWR